MSVIVLCTCNWGIPDLDALPPHYHYIAGRLPGDTRWLPGLISSNGEDAEQREFIRLEVRWDHDDLAAFIANVRDLSSPSEVTDG